MADGEPINGFLQSMGFVEQLEPIDDASYLMTVVNYADVNLQVWYGTSDQVISIHVWFADLPQVNVAPVMRRLLELNFVVETGFFSIQEVEGDDRIHFGTARSAEGLDLVGFKRMCDWAASGYWQYCRDLVEEFELAQERGDSGV